VVGMVIVSHSRKLAEGVKEISGQMADRQMKIIAAGGLEGGEIGTDAIRILKAIVNADTGSGVIILADLGSSILSSQTAIDLLDDEKKKKVKIADAPIVEGAVGAAIEASIGSSLEEVIAAAEEANEFQKL
jgi:phosphoenolpyruvate---glycerone phosphotransferase subunit DhaM